MQFLGEEKKIVKEWLELYEWCVGNELVELVSIIQCLIGTSKNCKVYFVKTTRYKTENFDDKLKDFLGIWWWIKEFSSGEIFVLERKFFANS